MIKGIDSRLYPEILHALASMGHGDTLVICDSNFPASSIAASTTWEKPIQWSVDAITALKLILSVIPIDTYDLEICPVKGMQVVDKPNEVPEVIATAKPILAKHQATIELVERHEFYQLAKTAFVILRSNESLPYGNFLIRKGVI